MYQFKHRGSTLYHYSWISGVLRPWATEERKRRILVVDDDRSLVTMLRILLTSSGFEVQTAGDGVEALALAETQSFDLILLDLQMPRMDGRQFFHEFRARGHTAPVVISSAYGAEEGKMELGAEEAVSKPFDPFWLADFLHGMVG